MTSAVTAPLERQFGQMPGLDQMSSTSSGGASVITLRFTLDPSRSRSPSRKCRRRSTPPTALLPNDLPQPPVYNKVNPADTPVLTLARDLDDGAAAGGPRPHRHARRSEAVAASRRRPGQHRRRPAARGAHPGQPAGACRTRPQPRYRCATAIAAANVNQPKGNFDGPERTFMLDANDQLRSPEAYRNLIVAYRGGRAAAAVGRRAGHRRRREPPARGVGRRCRPRSCVNVQRQPGANVIEVVDRVQKLLPQLTASLPPTLERRRASAIAPGPSGRRSATCSTS